VTIKSYDQGLCTKGEIPSTAETVSKIEDTTGLPGGDLCWSLQWIKDYKTKYEAKEAELIFTRSLLQRAAMIPPDQYQTVRGFFEKKRAAEVLVRQQTQFHPDRSTRYRGWY
jgi:hypothetical protein